jgi:hypothetical protein
VEQRGILRLWSAKLDGMTWEVDARIRNQLGPAAAAASGLVAFYPGRRGAESDAARVLATVWESESAMAAAAEPGGLSALAAELVPGTEEVIPLALRELPATSTDEPPAILRVFRGVVREGHMQAYIDAAQRGTREDIDAGAGPLALFLGVAGVDRFVTVSAWASWRNLEIATGGNVHQPVSTRNLEQLVSGSVTHYEILPGSTTGTSRLPTTAS